MGMNACEKIQAPGQRHAIASIYKSLFVEASDFHGCLRRLAREPGGVDLVHPGEQQKIRKEDVHLSHTVEAGAGLGQDGFDIVDRLPRLPSYPTGDERASRRVYAKPPGNKNQSPSLTACE